MKKQIILVVSIALVAILLFTGYMVFLRDDGVEKVEDAFYTLTEEVKNQLSSTESDVDIELFGYDSSNTDWEMVYRFALAVENCDDNIKVKTNSSKDGEFSGVRISVNGETKDVSFNDFFKTHYDGTKYAFDGESLICNGIFALTGKEGKDIPARGINGYDGDGDMVTANGEPFMFPSIDRSKISFLTIKNNYGEYSIIQENNRFYFDNSSAIAYDDEMFSLLTTRCRHTATYGKMELPSDKTWATYGIVEKYKEDGTLESITGKNGTYTLMTVEDKDGNYLLHTVYIGDLAPNERYYYARYTGGVLKPSDKEGEGDKMIHTFAKDFIYFLPRESVDNAIGLPKTDIMNKGIINVIEDPSKLAEIGDIRIDLYNEGIQALARKTTALQCATNLVAADTSNAAIGIVTDKKFAKESYASYEGAWLNNLDVFGGFKVTSGSSSYLVAALARYPQNGEYKVSFGLVRDEENKAITPKKFTVYKSNDGTNWTAIENASVTVDQQDKSIKNYEIGFTDANPIKFIRLSFDAPTGSVSFVVFDEIRIYGDGIDLQPTDTFMGSWKLVTPKEYIPQGYNYAYLDMTTFNDFVQSIATLEGEKVVGCGFSENGDASKLKTEVLAEFGLDKPEKHYSFEYQGVVTNLYASESKTEKGKYYVYTTFDGEVNGEKILATTDVIVELSASNVKWLDWSLVDYTNHAPITMYINDIHRIDITVDGVEYDFTLDFDDKGATLEDVVYNGKSYSVDGFKMLYEYMLRIQMKGKYTPEEGAEMEEWLRIRIHSDVNSPEFVFYRVDSARCYYTVDGQGGYYALVTDVNEIRDNLQKYLSGELITRR